jgi:GNAT-like C-terminal domain/N-acyltransferase N-terminal domain
MITNPTIDVRERLTIPDLPERILALGFRDRDATDLLSAIELVLDREDDLDTIAGLAGRLVDRIGDFGPGRERVWDGLPARQDEPAAGLLPMLALLVTASEVAAFHTVVRGIPARVSTATLAELGQQVWVHRLTDGEFGLHTHDWLTVTWSGALYWLGRLQFNLQRETGESDGWVLSTHIPRSGPLTPDAVDAAFAAATEFFGTYFPDYPTREFFCHSWLLDPALARLLPDSHLAAFQRRWTLDGDREPADADVLFFVFNRRTPIAPIRLPTDTSLRRAVASAMAEGYRWSAMSGRCLQ